MIFCSCMSFVFSIFCMFLFMLSNFLLKCNCNFLCYVIILRKISVFFLTQLIMCSIKILSLFLCDMILLILFSLFWYVHCFLKILQKSKLMFPKFKFEICNKPRRRAIFSYLCKSYEIKITLIPYINLTYSLIWLKYIESHLNKKSIELSMELDNSEKNNT